MRRLLGAHTPLWNGAIDVSTGILCMCGGKTLCAGVADIGGELGSLRTRIHTVLHYTEFILWFREWRLREWPLRGRAFSEMHTYVGTAYTPEPRRCTRTDRPPARSSLRLYVFDPFSSVYAYRPLRPNRTNSQTPQ